MTQHPDPVWMQRALALAQQGLYTTTPNPRVGCVLVNAQGEAIGEGFTQPAGQAHAEVMALRDPPPAAQRCAGPRLMSRWSPAATKAARGLAAMP